MESFTHYKINETADGLEVVLYLNENMMEFSAELGAIPKTDEANLKKDAAHFVKRMFPSLKIKTVKIMAGTMLLTTLGLGALPGFQASAAELNQAPIHKVSKGDTLYSIAKNNGTTVNVIKQMNNLSSNFLKIGQSLKLPSSVATTSTSTYQVVSGDTLYDIAQRYGTSVDAIKQVNNLTSNLLQIGQILSIPNGSIVAPSPTTSPVTSTSSYQVVPGDTLYDIAKRYGTAVDAIKQANQLSTNLLQVGQTLTIPNGSTVTPTPPSSNGTSTSTSYQVASGDTLYEIANRYGTSVDAIIQANGLSSNHLQIGQTLTIPSDTIVTKATTPAPTPTPAPAQTAPTEAEEQTEFNQEDVEWLAKMIYSEGRGESFEGQVAIGAVIMNRVESPLFPNTVKEVLFEKSYGYYQFTPAETGVINTAKPNAENYEAAKRALSGEDPTDGALFFYNPDKTSSSYLKSRTVSKTIGNHVFAF